MKSSNLEEVDNLSIINAQLYNNTEELTQLLFNEKTLTAELNKQIQLLSKEGKLKDEEYHIKSKKLKNELSTLYIILFFF